MKDVYKAIKDRLSLTIIDLERANILRSESLKSERCILIFEGLQEGNDFQYEVLVFLEELARETKHLKSIVLVEDRTTLPKDIDHNFEMIEISYLTESQAIDYFYYLV